LPEKLVRLKEILIRENKSGYWLAKRTEISYNSIHGYLNYKIEPSLTNLYRMAKALDVDVKDLLMPNK